MTTSDVLNRRYPGRRAQLKRDILSKALTCFNTHGLDVTTIEMIKDECETSVGNIYHHFGSKDGLVAALFFCALEDQNELLDTNFSKTKTVRERVAALVHSYLDWVSLQPELARFQFQARSAVAKGPFADELQKRNKLRNRDLIDWFKDPAHLVELRELPAEILPSLIIGQSENYCKAWLSRRVRTIPSSYKEQFADAAWRSIAMDVQA